MGNALKKTENNLKQLNMLEAIQDSWAWEYHDDLNEIISELRNENHSDEQIQKWLNNFIKNPPEYIKTLSSFTSKNRKYV